VDPDLSNIPEDIRLNFSNPSFVANALVNRGIFSVAQAKSFFDTNLYKPNSFFEFVDIEKAAYRIHKAIDQDELIGVWGDFDVDGQTATSLLVICLQKLGARIIYHIPNRANEGHGITLTFLQKFLQKGVNLLITCDTGIAANKQVEYASEKKVDVIITDHHALPVQIPDAFAVINPKLLSEEHPLSTLSGVGTAYQLARALLYHTPFENEMDSILDLVALGTIADISELNTENRYLVKKGLYELQQNRRTAFQELYSLIKFEPSLMNEDHISYILAPRMNAIGRLSDANVMIEFLTTQNKFFARKIADQLEMLNTQRKLAVDQIYNAIHFNIDNQFLDFENPIFVMSQIGWEPGVTGIVASRLVEKYNKPTILLSIDEKGTARGSARSIQGFNIIKAISELSHLLLSYGGHPMAAGFSLRANLIKEFTRQINCIFQKNGQLLTKEKEIHIDGFFSVTDIDEQIASKIELFAPFGNNNPRINLVCQNLRILNKNAIGKTKEHLLVTVEDQHEKKAEIIYWQGATEELPETRFDLVYTARTRNYEGQKETQLEWIASRPIENGDAIACYPGRKYKVFDFRNITKLEKLIEITNKITKVTVWAESLINPPTNFLNRLELSQCDVLAIGIVPPDQETISKVLGKCQPNEIYLFGIKPKTDSLNGFLTHLMGLMRFAIRTNEGLVYLDQLACLTSQTTKCIQKGIDYLVSRGEITIFEVQENQVKIKLGGYSDLKSSRRILEELLSIIKESASFRNYVLRTEDINIFLH